MSETVEKIRYYSPDEKPFVLDGLYFHRSGRSLNRLPDEVFISKMVNELAGNPAGGMLRFKTDSAVIRVRVEFLMTGEPKADHMAQTGSMGFDLYMGSGTEKVFAGVSRFPANSSAYESVLLDRPDRKGIMEEYTLHLPLYGTVRTLALGLDADAHIEGPSPWKDPRPVVVYGTSIQQGGCASRPGMCHTNQMSRLLDRPFLNFGFSGSAKGEQSMAQLLASIKDPAMYVLDYDANAGSHGLLETLEPFIRILRSEHETTPILLVSKTPYGKEFNFHEPSLEERRKLTKIHLDMVEKCRREGDHDIHFLDGSTLYGKDASECTVDGAHATDLGFYFLSRNMAQVIEEILSPA